jgi:AraC family transcriptional regulator
MHSLAVSRIEVRRAGRVEPLLQARPRLSSAGAQWGGLTLEEHSIPPCVVPRHEHIEDFLMVVLAGRSRLEIVTRGRSLRFDVGQGATFILPRGTVDEKIWQAPMHRIALALHPSLLIGALNEPPPDSYIELAEHWNVADRQISAVVHAMAVDLEEGSPAGPLYGESLANALAVHLLERYAVRRYRPLLCKGGLPGYRLKRVVDYIAENLSEDLSLARLAEIAGMSTHYFAELFRQSTGEAPHRYVLERRIERAKDCLRNPARSVVEAGIDAGFQNASHFARMFRKFVGVSPSRFREGIR